MSMIRTPTVRCFLALDLAPALTLLAIVIIASPWLVAWWLGRKK